jgi:hypothetical protein
VLLEAALEAIERNGRSAPFGWHVLSAKFHRPVRPGEPLHLEHEALADGAVRFTIRISSELAASGLVRPAREH